MRKHNLCEQASIGTILANWHSDWQHAVVTKDSLRVITDIERVAVVSIDCAVRCYAKVKYRSTLLNFASVKEASPQMLKVHVVVSQDCVTCVNSKTETIGIASRSTTSMLVTDC